jgi:hypothetical protein
MAEEQFFPLFISRLREEIEKIPPYNPAEPLKEIYREYWVPFGDSVTFNGPVVACDGSQGKSELSGGLVAWMARAIAHISAGGPPIKAKPEVRVKVGYGLEGESIFMKAVELQTLKAALEEALREYGDVLALHDGSLYLTFLHHPPYLEARAEVLREYVSALASLLELASMDGVRIVGVSKDSNITYLRAHIIHEVLSRNGVDMPSCRSIREIRKALDKLSRNNDSSLIKGYLEEVKSDTSDENLYNWLVDEPGFTKPLLLAPQTCYVPHERGRSWSESYLRTKSPEVLAPFLKEVDKLYDLPPVALTYWKPKHGLRTYRLDVPSAMLGCADKCGSMMTDKFASPIQIEAMKKLIAILNGLENEAYGMAPLLAVDEIVRLDHGRYKTAYEPIILEELKAHGHNVKLRKRSVRDIFMRRY